MVSLADDNRKRIKIIKIMLNRIYSQCRVGQTFLSVHFRQCHLSASATDLRRKEGQDCLSYKDACTLRLRSSWLLTGLSCKPRLSPLEKRIRKAVSLAPDTWGYDESRVQLL